MKYYFFLALFLFAFFTQAQEKRKSIAVNYGFGDGIVGRGFGRKLDGAGGGGEHHKSLNTIGISYWNEISKRLYIETGVHYLAHKYMTMSHMPPPIVYNHEIKLISIPLKLRYEAGKYIFFNGGFYVDLGVSGSDRYSNLSGVGFGIGAGLQYYFTKKLGIFTNPQFDFRNLRPFSSQSFSDKLFNTNLVLGLAYSIK